MNQQQFFQFNVPQQDQFMDSSTPDIQHNLFVLEMYNNWSFVRWLNYRYKNGILKQVDEMENIWMNYILNNNIDPEVDKDGSIFLRANMKNLNKE